MEVLETAVYAEDLEKARAFYEGVLGLPCFQYQPPRHAFFRAGKGVFLVFNPHYTAKEENLPPHGAQGSVHVAFKVAEEDLPLWAKKLEEAGFPVWWADWPRGKSLYTRDPAGNLVELAPAAIWGLE
ncbi:MULTISPECIES: VOC family protein [Thermus]|uniref:Glyoxalase n=1 Tax=Thermus scotoductus TaxID=37636 RepID=A0A0N0IQT9_THESC|nr:MULTISPECIES: VOC family protein [Thermus]KPD32105.1 glyoxalase [Thermus scotoductus]RTG94544.1 glyoxalase [Thermus scotoductus]RTH01207.1 glyoxalase [Thermus scotoductus]RTH01767.1 glyoxalase [Thermus scotoductus]RTH21638.1 glyoxalase [Thermus scotoductus]